jgi:uncharacterized GH25 family protein
MTSPVSAHMLWVNSFESFAHPPGHTTVSLGWGHALPIDDMTNSTGGQVHVEKFSLINPDGKEITLKKPGTKLAEPFTSNDDIDLFEADIACQKIALKKGTQSGVYLIEAMSKKAFHTKYIDTKGRTRFALKPKNEIDNIQKILFSVQYQAFAKSYLTVGPWSMPKPSGHGLEITPLTDLSKVRVGDLVKFDVRCHGKPLSKGPNGIEYITAFSSSFGLSDKFALFSYISEGKAQFRVQSSGQWLVSVFHKAPVTEDGPMKEFGDKVTSVGYGATLTFNVK